MRRRDQVGHVHIRLHEDAGHNDHTARQSHQRIRKGRVTGVRHKNNTLFTFRGAVQAAHNEQHLKRVESGEGLSTPYGVRFEIDLGPEQTDYS